MLLVAVFLVNLPFVHQTLADRELARSGKDVQATVLEARKVGDGYLVAYRLPRAVDPRQARYSGTRRPPHLRARAREQGPPGDCGAGQRRRNNRPEGEVTSNLFGIVALLGDLALLLVGLLGLPAVAAALRTPGDRGRRRRRHARLGARPGDGRGPRRLGAGPEPGPADHGDAAPGHRRGGASPGRRWAGSSRSTGRRTSRGAGSSTPGRAARPRARRTGPGCAWRPGGTGSGPTSVTRPRSAATLCFTPAGDRLEPALHWTTSCQTPSPIP